MQPIIAIAKKDLAQLFRDRAGFFFVFIFPVIFGIMFGLIFAGGSDGPSDVPLIVADLDGSESSQHLVDLLSADPKLAISLTTDLDESANAVRTGTHAGALVIPAGFSAALDGMFIGDVAELELSLDPSKSLESGLIRGAVSAAAYQAMFTVFQGGDASQRMLARARATLESAEDMNFTSRLIINTFLNSADSMMTLQAKGDESGDDSDSETATPGFQPIVIKMGAGQDQDELAPDAPRKPEPDSAFEITFPQAIAWGLMSCVLGFGLGVVGERTRGTLTRLRLSPIAPWKIIAGKALGCAVTCLGVQTLILVLGVSLFGVRPDSWLILVAGVLCATVAFVGLAMLLASLGRTETGSEGMSRAILLVLALVGGAGVPLAIMPDWVRAAASISPFKWVIQVLDGALWRQAEIGQVIAPCAVLIGIGVVGFAIGAVLFRRSAD